MIKNGRKATFTVEVPLKFKFEGSDYLDRDDLINTAIAEFKKRVERGDFDDLKKVIEITNKTTHYTRQELEEQERMWAKILGRK